MDFEQFQSNRRFCAFLLCSVVCLYLLPPIRRRSQFVKFQRIAIRRQSIRIGRDANYRSEKSLDILTRQTSILLLG